MQSKNSPKNKTLPRMQAFSNPTSHGVLLESAQVSEEQMLRKGRVHKKKSRPRKRSPTKKREPNTTRSTLAHTTTTRSRPVVSHQMKTQMMSPQQVDANLASLDRKLEKEHARRMELESMLRASEPTSPTSSTNSNANSSQQLLGTTLSARENQTISKNKNKNKRISSPGAVLRRGSQVDSAERTMPRVTTVYNRQYRHARDLETDMIRTEEELAITKSELSHVTQTLKQVQNNLDLRTTELDKSRGKVDSLLRIIKHVLQDLVEKRESRRFSMQASKELQRQINEPLSASFGDVDTKMSEYVDKRFAAIDAILPQWSAVYGENDMSPMDNLVVSDDDAYSDTSSYIDSSELPPPLPPAAGVSRRGNNASPPAAARNIPLPSPPPGAPMPTKGPGEEVETAPKESVKNALLEVWDRIDEEEDGILSVREIRDKLMSVVPGISVEVRNDVMQKLSEGALMLHGDGNAAFEEEQFVRALFSTTCGLRLVQLIEAEEAEENRDGMSEQTFNSQDKKKLNEWSRKMSLHALPRSIHDHKK